MLIFFQELVMLLFLWLLRVIDGIMEIFSAIAGVTDVTLNGEKVNIIEYLVGGSTVGTIFWCVFILAVGLTCIFGIVALVKNMIANTRTVSSIMGKVSLSLLGTMAMLTVVVLGILICNSILTLVAEIFQIGNTTKLSNALFNACAGKWINGYSMAEVDITSCSVREIMGDYNASSVLLGIWPSDWNENGMIDPEQFLYLPAMISSIALLIAMVVAIINLAKRVYEIVLLYIVMPVSMATLPLDDGARFKVWRETFVTKMILAYGTVFSVNIFILILPIITKMHVDGVGSFGNSMFLIFMIIGGAMVIPAGQTLFARLFGQADDMHAGGSFLHSAFYGGRIASALTFGAAFKLIKGGIGAGRSISNRRKKGDEEKSDGESSEDDSDKYTDEKSGDSSEGDGK
ncbi:MAG: hypothetical protein E7357_06095 [Clostridiales bacterium]|nr:hypothetical protein [Clostridiales bacterium]